MLWRQQAACADTDAEFLLDKGDEHQGPYRFAPALEICSGCPVRVRCLNYVQDDPGELAGVWGGSTTIERAEGAADPPQQRPLAR